MGATTEAILSVAAKPEHRFDVAAAFGLLTTTETPARPALHLAHLMGR
jgi:hypothetical protein